MNNYPLDELAVRLANLIAADEALYNKRLLLLGITYNGSKSQVSLLEKELKSKGISVDKGTIDLSKYDPHGLRFPYTSLTYIPCKVDKSKIVIFQEVIDTGRNVMAALREIVDYGRPDLVKLATMADTGKREITTIKPDYNIVNTEGRGVSINADNPSNRYLQIKKD
jgi:pyrimidine operon attenuation protein/uracil phosphoribosyltransferase